MAASPCYQERLTTGLYDSLVEDLLKLDKSVLANIDWGKDFRRDPQDKLQLIYADGRPFTTLIFGEIAPASMGTQHSAVGNHYMGSARKPVRHHASVLFLS